MKFLIVSSSDPIFLAMAKKLSELISDSHEKMVVIEASHIPIFKVLCQRMRRAGVLQGMSQFIFKIYDVIVLRRKESRSASVKITGFKADRIKSINSLEFRTEVVKYDVVICIATSIVNRETLLLSKHGFINIHPGILPRYRGTGNLWAVVNQDWHNIGCTSHWMTPQIDVGRILTVTRIALDSDSLWEMNCNALTAGIYALSSAINQGSLLELEQEVDESTSCYYSWYGVLDYFRFKRILRSKLKSFK
jgi:folate-dependent phosphoribosylglycinamide formyltransferase PurN